MRGKSKVFSLGAVVIFTIAGCVNPFAPELGQIDEEGTAILTDNGTPNEVLENFRYAYIYGDSLVYSDLIDTGFIFIFFDPNLEGTGRFDSWGRDLEVKTTAALFRAIGNISLEWNTTVDERYWSEQPDSVMRMDYFPDAVGSTVSKGFILKLGTEIQITGTAVFSFGREKVSDTWRITRWRDESIF